MQCKVIFLLVFCPIIAFSQKNAKGIEDVHYECSWNVKFVDDTVKMTQGIEDRIILQIGDNLSYQYSYVKQQSDSVDASISPFNTNQVLNYVENKINELRNGNIREGAFVCCFRNIKLYKDYTAKKIKVLHSFYNSWFTYEESLITQNWEILDDTTTIAGYFCQKAVCDFRGRSYEAWFAPEIPICEGPWMLYGLPGLIFRLNDIQHHYEFDLEEFKSVNNSIDTNVLTTNKMGSGNRTVLLTKVERKEFLRTAFGKEANRRMSAQIEEAMAKVGLPMQTPKIRHFDYIDMDYK